MTRKQLGVAAATLLLIPALGAHAQSRRAAAPRSTSAPAAVPAAAQAPLPPGPSIPGMCTVSPERALAGSTVGQAANTRMQQLRAQAAAELSSESNGLKTDVQAFQAKSASLTQDQQRAQAAPLQAREDALRQKAQQREAELEYTARHQESRILQTVNPIIRSLYAQRHCSVLLNGDSVLGANADMDMTPQVVAQLNTTMPTISFDRETPPAGAGGAQ